MPMYARGSLERKLYQDLQWQARQDKVWRKQSAPTLKPTPVPMEEIAATLRLLRMYGMVLDANALLLEVSPHRAAEVAAELRQLAIGLREMVQ